MVRTEPGPRGPRLLVNGKSLFSAYDPEREATRWVEQLEVPKVGTFFLVGDVLGLLSEALAERAPGAQVIALLPSPPQETFGGTAWWPALGPLEPFLEDILETTGPAHCHWLVWPAFERAAPDEVLAWTTSFRDVYRTVQGTWLTWRHHGRSWWKNALRNAAGWERGVSPTRGSKPIVVAASGPSLEEGLETLRACRADFDLWALPSSFSSLAVRGLEPDVGLTTDGGFYAREHLQRLAGTHTQVISALTGAGDPLLEERPTLFFSQGLPWETELLSVFPLAPTLVPSQGTVAVTALHWALALTTGPVFVAGLDLAFRDFRGHASGHTVERRLAPLVDRLRPWEVLLGERAFSQATVDLGAGVRTSPAMRTYALWLGGRARFARPILRVAPSALSWPGMEALSWTSFAAAVRQGRSSSPVTWNPVADWPSRSLRVRRLEALLGAWKLRMATAEPAVVRRWSETVQPELLQEHLLAERAGAARFDLVAPLVAFLETLEVR